jgi:hypothetical protein
MLMSAESSGGQQQLLKRAKFHTHPGHLHTQSLVSNLFALSGIVFSDACLGVIMALEVAETEACKVACLARSGDQKN